MHNLAAIHEAIARALPERECIVFRDRRFTWAQTTDRTRRLADVLRAHGLGCHAERRNAAGDTVLEGWESGQDHVALYLHNGNEYLEGMLGAFKARCAPFNVNYRYVDDELVYLLRDARARAVVFHGAFAPALARVRERLEDVRLWLQVDDGSGAPRLPGALDYEAALAAAAPAPPRGLSPDDLYVLYTGGTTGMPKGVLWRQQDIFLGALYPPGAPGDAEGVARRAVERGDPIRVLAAPPFMHGAAHWAAFNIAFLGGTVIVQSHPERLDPHDVWATVERERASALTIVGDAFARPLLDALAERRYDLSSLRLLTSGGAILSSERKRELLDAIPGLRINDSLGSSESGMQAVQSSTKGREGETARFELARANVVLSAALDRVLAPGDAEIGWLAKSGHVPLGYLGDPQKTARTFPVVDGVRHAVPGDRARLGADGRLHLLGRDSVTINSGGEKIFAEEVELALKTHPDVHDALVVGTPSERWGQQVTALVALRPGAARDDAALRAAAAAHLAGFKLPKAFVVVPAIARAPSGKPDYAWARAT
ncbi:MAG: AMP-binding protein, partial [Myxococcales bacterium]|nr:AMP-binding protein [Myxococcales bacterium]